MRAVLATILILVFAPAAADPIPAFSSLKPGQSLPSPLRFTGLPGIKHNRVSLVDDAGITVLKVESHNSAGSVVLPFAHDPAALPLLNWRWKVSRVLSHADMEEKTGDDFAARVYVFFDVPLAALSFSERTRIRLARLVAGPDVPTSALCYVWDNKHRIGYTQPSPYTTRVQKIVLQSGPEHAGKWMSETRDVAADFRAAFGEEPPRLIGVAVGNDTDNTDEQVTTWFGDVSFAVKPK
jgi:hypothetical protein